MPMNQMPQQMQQGGQQGQMGGVNVGNPQQQQQQVQQQQQMQNQMGPGGMNPNVMNQMGGQMNMGPGVGGMVPNQMGMGNPGMGQGPVGNNNMPVGVPQGMNPGGQMNPGMNVGNVVGGGGPVGVNQMQNSPGPMNPNVVGGNQMNMMNQMGMGRKPQEMMMNSPGNMFNSTGVRSVTPNQFLRENPSPSVPSPAMGNPQMIPSPAAMAQSPSPQMMNVNQRNNNLANVMAPSPNASLNTPGQPGNIPSPMNAQEDQLYKEKYLQLVKYIEPLKRMTAKMMHEKNSECTVFTVKKNKTCD